MVKDLRGPFLLATAIAFLAGALLSGEVEAGSLSREKGMGWAAAWSACDGTIGDCLGVVVEEEMAMDSESNRRILQGTGGHIVYNPALFAGQTLCQNDNRGAPYSNCRPPVLNHFPRRDCKSPQCYRKTHDRE